MIKAVLFDLDGTLFDTSEGIFKCANQTMVALGRKGSDDVSQLSKFVGPPLRECFRITFGLEEEFLDEACEIYRREYRKDGMLRCSIYPGMLETLKGLKMRGYKVGVCTLKYETLAKEILQKKGVGQYFDEIFGTNAEGTISKSDAILLAVKAMGVAPYEALMVGDTANDETGAEKAGVLFCAALWGFGFRKETVNQKLRFATAPLDVLAIVDKGDIDMDIVKIDTKKAPGAIGPYSQAVAVGDFIFASGQIPVDPATGSIVDGGVVEQAKQCFRNINAVLDEAGSSITKVVKATVFLKDMGDFAAVNGVYADAFKDAKVLPARSAVAVACLPKNVMVEIEVVAIR